MSLFGTYIKKNNTLNNIKEEKIMSDNYGIIVNEDGQKELIELSEAEMAAVLEAREVLEEKSKVLKAELKDDKRLAKLAKEAKKKAADDAKAAANRKESMERAKEAFSKSAKKSYETFNKDMYGTGAKAKIKGGYDKALNAVATKFNMNTATVQKILIAAGAALAAGGTVAAVTAAIRNKKKKDESTNESVMLIDESGNTDIVEITNEEYEALVEARIEMDEDNVCRLTLTMEEANAILEAREEDE